MILCSETQDCCTEFLSMRPKVHWTVSFFSFFYTKKILSLVYPSLGNSIFKKDSFYYQ